MKCPACGQEHPPEESCRPAALATGHAHSGTTRPPAEPPDPLIGSNLGSFKIVKLLGRGGMGTVYLGEHAAIGSRVAVKVLHDHLASSPSLVKRFYDEARAVNVIGHENIVNIIDLQTAPKYYMVMEYLEGEPLHSMLRGPIPAKVAIPILLQVCDALQAAHARGVVHRDLKPENIFLVRRGRRDNVVKILDFGIAKLFQAETPAERTQVGMIVGTPEYMAPEQANNEPVDGRTDLYALGIIGFLMAVGRLPFYGGGLTGLLLAHRTQAPEVPHVANPAVSVAWSQAVLKALEKRKEHRFPDAAAFAEALEQALAAEEEAAPALAVGAPSPRPSAPAGPAAAPPPAPSAPQARPATPAPQAVQATPSPLAEAARASPAPAPAVPVGPFPPTQAPVGAPTSTETPQPAHPRHQAEFETTVMDVKGNALGKLKCRDISKGGAFLCTEGPFPPLFSRVRVRLESVGKLETLAEVVRHVSREQAEAWKMSPGFGVQFVDLTPQQREALAALTHGLPVARPTVPLSADDDDMLANRVLGHYAKRVNGDHYVVLALKQDAEFAEIRARGREAERELELLKQRPLSARQRAQVDTVLAKIHAALETVGHAANRLHFDANRANFRGVARCIAAGLSVTELEVHRKRFLQSHPGAESQAQVKFTMGQQWERKGELPLAVEAFEAALALDPINLHFQQTYWGIKRKQLGVP